MPDFSFYDRVKETTTTTGTGTITLAGAVAGFRSFSVVGNGIQCYYCIEVSGGDWEVGIGTYTSSGTTLSRTTVLASSNSGSLVNFASGTKKWSRSGQSFGFVERCADAVAEKTAGGIRNFETSGRRSRKNRAGNWSGFAHAGNSFRHQPPIHFNFLNWHQ